MNKKLPKGFIPLGRTGYTLNQDCVRKVKIKAEENKAFLTDTYGLTYTVEPKALKGKTINGITY